VITLRVVTFAAYGRVGRSGRTRGIDVARGTALAYTGAHAHVFVEAVGSRPSEMGGRRANSRETPGAALTSTAPVPNGLYPFACVCMCVSYRYAALTRALASRTYPSTHPPGRVFTPVVDTLDGQTRQSVDV